jgi:hypothetical protein
LNKKQINTGLKSRLDLILRELGLSGRAFEKECGLANGSYSSIGDGVGADKLIKILLRFPNISAEWLVCGNGKMMKTDCPEKICQDFENYDNELPARPVSREDMKTILLEMSGIVSCQQEKISQLITELEQTGKKSGRMLELIHVLAGITNTAASE